jgi:hypothetical protein
MRYLSAWQNADYATLYSLTCAKDRADIELFKKSSVEVAVKAKALGYSHSIKPIHEQTLLSALLGQAPDDMSLKIPTRFTLKRSSLSEKGALGGWPLSKEGGEYFVCFTAKARVELQRQLTEVKKVHETLDLESDSRAITVDE